MPFNTGTGLLGGTPSSWSSWSPASPSTPPSSSTSSTTTYFTSTTSASYISFRINISLRFFILSSAGNRMSDVARPAVTERVFFCSYERKPPNNVGPHTLFFWQNSKIGRMFFMTPVKHTGWFFNWFRPQKYWGWQNPYQKSESEPIQQKDVKF